MHPTAAAVASLIWPSGNHRSFEPPREHPSSLWESSIYLLNLPTRLPEDPKNHSPAPIARSWRATLSRPPAAHPSPAARRTPRPPAQAATFYTPRFASDAPVHLELLGYLRERLVAPNRRQRRPCPELRSMIPNRPSCHRPLRPRGRFRPPSGPRLHLPDCLDSWGHFSVQSAIFLFHFQLLSKLNFSISLDQKGPVRSIDDSQ